MADGKYEATASAVIPAPPDRAWEALATSEGFSRLYEGMNVECDWKVGGPIVWSGEWEGKKFKDTGTLKVYDRPRLFVYTYWTSFWGTEPDEDSIQTIRNERQNSIMTLTASSGPEAAKSKAARDSAKGYRWVIRGFTSMEPEDIILRVRGYMFR
jgi:uncharacterized protein YndB with AHSA1/START domain